MFESTRCITIPFGTFVSNLDSKLHNHTSADSSKKEGGAASHTYVLDDFIKDGGVSFDAKVCGSV